MTAVEQRTDVVTLNVNGTDAHVAADHPHLLSALRDDLGLTAAKDGCSPSGQCGCCTVLVDGKAMVSCQQSLEKMAGRSIVTLEGVEQTERDRYAEVFAATGALQCGFCTPGIVMRAKSLVDRKGSDLQRDDAARLLGGHLCRCTGYVKILDAIECLAQGTMPETPCELPRGIGQRGKRYQAEELSLGDRGYIDDLRLPGTQHAALHLTAHARADILAIDTTAALAHPGVSAVLTAEDIPGELKVGIIHQDWPVMIPVGGRTSYLGDVLAVVVAVDRRTARAAAELIEVTYEVHTPITDPIAALDADAPDAVWGLEGNQLSRSTYARGGDIDEALAASTHAVHELFQTQRIEQAFLEPESTLAVPSTDADGRRTLHVYSGGQGVWDDRNQIASVLAISQDDITVELVSNGGAFGGKEDMSNQAHAALAAWILHAPVSCTSSREESLLMHAKRHPIRLEYWAGCDDDGRLTALKARMIGDSGPYASVGMKVLERAAGHAGGPYRVPAIDVDSIAVRTNNPVCGAFRGFGANQAQFAMEGVMDRLAEAVGISGWEMRKRNVIRPGDVWGPGQIMDDGAGGAEVCLDQAKPHYDAALAAGKAVGLGLGLKNSGLGNGFREVCAAVVRFVSATGRIEVRHGWTEMGQGVHTVAMQVAATELGVEPERIDVIVDTTRALGFGQTTGSRGTLMASGSVKAACDAAITSGLVADVDHYGEYVVDWTQQLGDRDHANPIIHAAFGYAAQLVIADAETAKIEKFVAIHDVGKAMNPVLCEGQIEGAVHMGLGYALTEDFPADELGQPTNMTLRSLGILRAKDVPTIEVELVEVPQPRSPYGVKGVGEIGLVPTAGAVAAMLHSVDGEWRTTLPLKPRSVDE